MVKLDFWRLKRSIQERFVASTEGAAAPAPLAIEPLGRDTRLLVWLAVGSTGVLASGVALAHGFGALSSRYALSPPWFIALYATLFAVAAFGFLRAAARYVSAYAVPYRPAVYLFPIGVIDARAPHLVVHRISEHTEIHFDPARRCLRLEIEGAKFEFSAADATRAEQAQATLIELRDRLANSGPESSAREQALVDPLLDNGFTNPFSPSESLHKALPLWVTAVPGLALILGVLLGGASFLVRNHLSEGRLYAAARTEDQSDAYRTYLSRGGKNPDVPTLLLPRAELRDAQRQGTVLALEQFAASHPHTPIQPEVDQALQATLVKELSLAEAQGTLGALKDFAAHYAHYSFLTPAIDRALDARIEGALQRLKPTLAPNQSRLFPFMERLLRYTTKHGPEVSVRFQRKPTESLETAEKTLRQNAYFHGDAALPGQYFDEAHQTPREAATAAALVAALNQHFPPDLAAARLGPPLDANADSKPTVPTLLITYHTEMSGAFTSRKPRLALTGIGVLCKASFEIPGDPEPLTFKLTVWRAPDLKTITDTSTPASLYEAMAGEAFKRFTKKYLATLFVER